MRPPAKLPYKTFLKTFDLVPRLAICLFIHNPGDKSYLLAKRIHPPLLHYWHLPGSFLLKNETLEACINRVGDHELNLKLESVHKQLLGVFENLNRDPRGHVIDLVYQIDSRQISDISNIAKGKASFFTTIPKRVGFRHDQILRQLDYKDS